MGSTGGLTRCKTRGISVVWFQVQNEQGRECCVSL